MLFTSNRGARPRLELLDSELVEWRGWAKDNGFLREGQE